MKARLERIAKTIVSMKFKDIIKDLPRHIIQQLDDFKEDSKTKPSSFTKGTGIKNFETKDGTRASLISGLVGTTPYWKLWIEDRGEIFFRKK